VTVVATDDGPRVDSLAPVSARPEQYRDVNIQAGDLILTANGVRIKSLADLQQKLEAAAPGDMITLGLQRMGGLAVAKYTKAGIAEPAVRREVVTAPKGNEAQRQATGGARQAIVKIDGGGAGKTPWVEVDVVLDDSEGKVRVFQILDLPPEIITKTDLAVGDRIASIQDVKVSSAAELLGIFEKAKPGEQISLSVDRDGKEHTITFEKKEPPAGCMKIKR
jgi:S1-C subfamily serine protease